MKRGLAILFAMCVGALAKKTCEKYHPLVIMHGFSSSGAKLEHLATTAMEEYPGLYAVSVSVDDNIKSMTTQMPKMVATFADVVNKNPKLANGFNLLGNSQGGLVSRAYIEQYNDPKVFNFVSGCGPQEGIGSCPGQIGGPGTGLCKWFNAGDPYLKWFSFDDFWKNPTSRSKYLKDNKWLSDLNNEQENKNSQYRDNMLSLESYVLVKALKDTTVYPKDSEWHSFNKWGTGFGEDEIVPMLQTDGYVNDWIGLRTLNETGRLFRYAFDAGHVQYSNEFFVETMLPHLVTCAED